MNWRLDAGRFARPLQLRNGICESLAIKGIRLSDSVLRLTRSRDHPLDLVAASGARAFG
jgi:hypothetical protein